MALDPKSSASANSATSAHFFGGGWWIRTTEVDDNRFTVCPLWPLGKSSVLILHGAGDRNRTYNLLITSQLLYRWATPAYNLVFISNSKFGGTNRARTCDPLLVRQVLSQLSYSPILVTRRGIEPLLPPWKGGVLTSWPTSHILVIYPRLERGTPWLKVRCSTDWANRPHFFDFFRRFFHSQVIL